MSHVWIVEWLFPRTKQWSASFSQTPDATRHCARARQYRMEVKFPNEHFRVRKYVRQP